MNGEIMLVIDDNGVAHEHKKPYAIIECKTKEDFEKLKEAHEKQAPNNVTNTYKRCGFVVEGCCPCCGLPVLPEHKYCNECGQKLAWEKSDDE